MPPRHKPIEAHKEGEVSIQDVLRIRPDLEAILLPSLEESATEVEVGLLNEGEEGLSDEDLADLDLVRTILHLESEGIDYSIEDRGRTLIILGPKAASGGSNSN